jgi:hypothetical protein
VLSLIFIRYVRCGVILWHISLSKWGATMSTAKRIKLALPVVLRSCLLPCALTHDVPCSWLLLVRCLPCRAAAAARCCASGSRCCLAGTTSQQQHGRSCLTSWAVLRWLSTWHAEIGRLMKRCDNTALWSYCCFCLTMNCQVVSAVAHGAVMLYSSVN